jgi:hypothetical protein
LEGGVLIFPPGIVDVLVLWVWRLAGLSFLSFFRFVSFRRIGASWLFLFFFFGCCCEVKVGVVKPVCVWGLGKKEEAGVDAALIFFVYNIISRSQTTNVD